VNQRDPSSEGFLLSVKKLLDRIGGICKIATEWIGTKGANMPYFLQSIYQTDVYEEKSLEEIVDIIQHDYKDTVFAIRHEKDEKERKRLKGMLPAFSLCEFDYGKLEKKNLTGTKYFIYDIDKLDKQKMSQLAGEFKKFAKFWFTTPSGKGYKFIIEMEEFVPIEKYEYNWQYYYDYFCDSLYSELDKQYRIWHTFFSHDAECYINPDAKQFKVYDEVIERKANDVDVETMDSSEIDDVARYIANRSDLHYMDWLKIGLALKSLGTSRNISEDIGLKAWLTIEQIDKGRFSAEHAHRDYRRKWDSLKPEKTRINTLFWMAFELGYKRNPNFTNIDKAGYLCPFEVRDNGLYSIVAKGKDKKVTYEFVYSFKSIRVVYSITNKDSSLNKIGFSIDGKVIEIPSESLAAPSNLHKAILREWGEYIYLCPTSNTATWTKLCQWIGKTADKEIRLKDASGLGNVAPGLWNLGNVVITDKGIYPYQEVFYVNKIGYALERNEQTLSELSVQSSSKFWEMLKGLYEFYDEWAAIALGWATSNIFFEKIVAEKQGFPVLFVHGKTMSGKSQFAHLILSMFGVANPEAGSFKLNMDKATPTAIARVKGKAVGIPHMFDEFGSSNAKDTFRQFLILKSMFDATGKEMAKHTNDMQTHRIPIRSGSMFTACDRITEAEGVNRCVYANLSGLSQRKDGKEYLKRYGGSKRQLLSAFIIMVITHIDYKTWDANFHKAYDEILDENIENRVLTNYATVMAGYYSFMDMIKDKTVFKELPKIPVSWWKSQILDVVGYSQDSDPSQLLFSVVNGIGDISKLDWVEITDYISPKGVYGKKLLVMVKDLYSWIALNKPHIILPEAKRMHDSLKSCPEFVSHKSQALKGSYRWCYEFIIFDEADEKPEYNEVPF